MRKTTTLLNMKFAVVAKLIDTVKNRMRVMIHMRFILFGLLLLAEVHAGQLDKFVENYIYFNSGAGEDRFVVKDEYAKLKDEFTYFELSIFAEKDNVNFSTIVNADDDSVNVDSLARLILMFGVDKLSSENLIWIRTAPLYRTPQTKYSGVWIRFTSNRISFNAENLKANLKIIDSGKFESVGQPVLLVE